VEFLATRQADDGKIAPIQSEDGVNAFAICQMRERSIGKLQAEISIAAQNRGYARKIGRFERRKIEEAVIEGREEEFDRVGVGPQ